ISYFLSPTRPMKIVPCGPKGLPKPLTRKCPHPTLPPDFTFWRTDMLKTRIVVLLAFLMGVGSLYGQDSKSVLVDYRLLATNKTSTMTKELNEAAAGGFRLEGAMGGESAYGGAEVVAIMSRN